MPDKEEVIAALKSIIDPHVDTSVYDLRLIHDLRVTKDTISLTFKPTSPWCPLGVHLAMNIKRRLMEIKGVKKVELKVSGHMHENLINEQLADG